MRRLASLATVLVGSLALHQLSYRGAHGAHAQAALDQAGHGYLQILAPVLVVLAPVLIAVSLIGPALIGVRSARRPSVLRLAAWLSLAMLAMFVGQELFEAASFSQSTHAIADLLALLPFAAPMAFALGIPAAFLVGAVWRQSDRLIAAARRPDRLVGPAPRIGCGLVNLSFQVPGAALSSGFARRPPPGLSRA